MASKTESKESIISKINKNPISQTSKLNLINVVNKC